MNHKRRFRYPGGPIYGRKWEKTLLLFCPSFLRSPQWFVGLAICRHRRRQSEEPQGVSRASLSSYQQRLYCGLLQTKWIGGGSCD